MSAPTELPDDFIDLVDCYCSELIDEREFQQLEAYLLGSDAARRYFVEYFHHHTEIHFAIRAKRATAAVLDHLRLSEETVQSTARMRPWRAKSTRRRWITGVAAGILAVVAVAGALARVGAIKGLRHKLAGRGTQANAAANANVAWLVNAQNCRWAGTEAGPGRDMHAGKSLKLEKGLAEIEFDQGAHVILQGPAGLELLSGSKVRLTHGTLTARVPPTARGFTVISPGGRVVDLGTEFGLNVDEGGGTTVRVFTGEVEAFPTIAGGAREHGITIHQDQTARIDGRSVALKSTEPENDLVTYVRAIELPAMLTARSLELDFSRPLPGSIMDRDGRGVGFSHRLPGTGGALPARDPNIRLQPDEHCLELTTTRSDINTQEGMPTGEYLGVRLADLGFTGKEDFEISATIHNIPGLKVVGQFGLYVGASSDRNIRGGLISWPQPDSYRLFLVNNRKGIDQDLYEVGLMTTGDDLRLSLCRKSGRYSLVVDNLTRKSSSTLNIAHPAFLDPEVKLYAGLFGANTQSEQSKTLTIREVKVTVWTIQPSDRTMGIAGGAASPRRISLRP
jgi:hypothetical protein